SAWPPDSPTTSAATSTGRRTCSSDFCGAPTSIRPNSRRSNAPIVGDNVAPRAGSEARMKPPVAMLLIALVPAAISAHHSVVAYYDTKHGTDAEGLRDEDRMDQPARVRLPRRPRRPGLSSPTGPSRPTARTS